MQSDFDPLARLWSVARAAFAGMRAAVGEAAALALEASLEPKQRRAIAAWLRPIEALVRCIVLIEAAAFARQPEPPQHPERPRATAPCERKPALRLWPRSRPAPARIRLLGEPTTVAEIWRERARRALVKQLAEARAKRLPAHVRLARRMDALARVIAHPQAAARRLARKLRRRPRLALELAAKPPARAHLVDADACADARRRASAAALALNDSS